MKDKFPGFSQDPFENWWPYPKELGQWWFKLTGSEQKVLDYILRHTLGFQKTSDAISYRQFIHGVRNCDKGCGIKSTATLSKAFDGLIEKGFIFTIGERTTGQPIQYYLTYKTEGKEGEGLQKLKSRSAKDKEVRSSETKDTIDPNSIEYIQYIYNNKNNSYSSIENITEEDITEISERYSVSIGFVKLQLEKLHNWCEAKGKSYKDYKKALMNWVLLDMQRASENKRLYGHKGGIDARGIK
jgi:hypothetical protein